MANPKYYYHITQKKWPDKLTLYPKVHGYNRCTEEPEIARTCVSPIIEGCLIALGLCLMIKRPIYIYRSENKVLARNPYRVIDSFITKEKWITKPIIFKKVGVINDDLPEEIRWLSTGNCHGLKDQKKYFNKLNKMNLSFVDWL